MPSPTPPPEDASTGVDATVEAGADVAATDGVPRCAGGTVRGRGADADTDADWAATRDVGDMLRLLSLDLHRYVHLVAREIGVPPTDIHAVGVLQAAEEPVSAAVLGRALGLTPSATTSLIDRLGATGHAVRGTASGDARRAAIEPTDLALGHSAREFYPLTRAIHEALAAVPSGDVDVFRRVLRAVQLSMHGATEQYSRR